jgi:hypothetical protein
MSTLLEIEGPANKSDARRERTESRTEPKSSVTSEWSSGPKLVLAYCVWALLYLFPVAMLLEIKDTTQRTEKQVDKVAAGISVDVAPEIMDQINMRMASR